MNADKLIEENSVGSNTNEPNFNIKKKMLFKNSNKSKEKPGKGYSKAKIVDRDSSHQKGKNQERR
jgi:hypothetical protein